jgi:hypothetical protein
MSTFEPNRFLQYAAIYPTFNGNTSVDIPIVLYVKSPRKILTGDVMSIKN